MARRAREAQGEVSFRGSEIPDDAPASQLADVYAHFENKSQLNWGDIPSPPDLK